MTDAVRPTAPSAAEAVMSQWGEDQILSSHKRVATFSGIMAGASLAAIPIIPTIFQVGFGSDWIPSNTLETVITIVALILLIVAALLFYQAQAPIPAKINLGILIDDATADTDGVESKTVMDVYTESLDHGREWNNRGFVVLILALVLSTGVMFYNVTKAEDDTSGAGKTYALVLDTAGVLHCGPLQQDQNENDVKVGSWIPTDDVSVKQLWLMDQCTTSD